jgi:hypothetical protein
MMRNVIAVTVTVSQEKLLCHMPQSTKGGKVMMMPAAAINFRKSRPDTRGLLLADHPRLILITCPETCVQRACDKKRLGY